MEPLLTFFLLPWAFYRNWKAHGVDLITMVVAIGMASSILTVWRIDEAHQHYILALIDAMVALGISLVVFRFVNKGARGFDETARRAQFVTWAACAKVSVWIIYHAGGFAHWNTAAAWSNALLVYQILVAGGVGHVAICRGAASLSDAVRKRIRGGEDRRVA